MEWDRAGESLVETKRTSAGNRTNLFSSVYLDHDHCKRENIRLLVHPSLPIQDLRCGPPSSVAIRHRGLIEHFLTLGEAEICDACAVRGIDENVWLHSFDR